MLGSPRTRAKRFYRRLRSDVEDIGALLGDPVQSRSYYPDEPGKPKARIAMDLAWWWLRHREVNRYYYMLGLDRRGAAPRELLPYRRFRRLRNARNLHPAGTSPYYNGNYNYLCVMRDKFVFSSVLQGAGFPVPEALAVLSPDGLQWMGRNPGCAFEALTAKDAPEIDGLCKPIDGIMGAGIFLLDSGPGRLLIDGTEATPGELRRRITGRYLLQRRISQHPELAALHPQSVNTLRLVTVLEGEEATLLSSSLRVGTGGSTTDNWSDGGILLNVDPDSGRVRGEGVMKPAFGLRVSEHPDSGIRFDGFAVPKFDEAVALARSMHRFIAGIHSIGWDIAITPDGPVALEGNDDWDGAIPMLFDSDFSRKFLVKFA